MRKVYRPWPKWAYLVTGIVSVILMAVSVISGHWLPLVCFIGSFALSLFMLPLKE